MITTLLLKTHNVTGLKYFCQTAKEGRKRDRYRGSGKIWTRHIRKHGGGNEFVTTHIVAEYDCYNLFFEEEISTFALKYSSDHNIVDDPGYANLEPENGLDGGVPGQKRSDETKAKIGAKNTGRKLGPQSDEHKAKREATKANKTPEQKDETKAKQSAGNKGRKHSAEHIANNSAAKKGNTNAKGNKGKKRTPETKAKMSASKKGKKLGPRSDENKAKRKGKKLGGWKLSEESIAKRKAKKRGPYKKKALKDQALTVTH